MRLKYLFLLVGLFLGNYVFAQKPQLRIEVDSSQIQIGMPFNLHLKIENINGKEVKYPSFIDSIDTHFDILKSLPSDSIANGISINYQIASYEFGEFTLGPFPFRYEENGILLSDSSNAVLVKVIAPEVDTTKGFKDIYGVVDEPFSWKEMWKPVSLGALVILFIVALVYFVIRYIKARNAKRRLAITEYVAPIDAYKEAMDALQNMKQKQAAENEDPKLYYTELTNILRIYFERKLGFNAPEMISDEILDALKVKRQDATVIDHTKAILQNADLAKFAKSTPDISLRSFDLDRAFLLIDKLNEKQGGAQ